jgi:hypothetical protein
LITVVVWVVVVDEDDQTPQV